MRNKEIKSVFFGTPRFSVYVLDALKAQGFTPTLIVTAPDKPQGRKLLITPPEVKVWAQENGVDVYQPDDINEEVIAELGNTEWDLFLLASYGKILPQELLDLPKHGTLNVHPSLLPKYRGASPIKSQILADDRKTGITIMLMDEKMDHGPTVAQASVEIEEGDWPLHGSTLEEMLATEGGTLLAETITPFINGEITPSPQEHAEATFTKKMEKKDGEIDPMADARENFLKIRAFDEWPGTFFMMERKGKQIRVKITDAELEDGKLLITKVIPEGKKEMTFEDFERGQ